MSWPDALMVITGVLCFTAVLVTSMIVAARKSAQDSVERQNMAALEHQEKQMNRHGSLN